MGKPTMSVYQSKCVWTDAEHPNGYSPTALCESYGDDADPLFAVVEQATLQIIGLYSTVEDAVAGKKAMEKNATGNEYSEKYALTGVLELL